MTITWSINDNYNDVMINGDGKLAIIKGAPQVRQRVIIALRHYWQEYFLNVPAGMPWYELILGSKDLKQAEALIRNAVLDVPDVISILNLSNMLSMGRNLSFDMRIEVVGENGSSIEDISFSLLTGG